MGTREIGKLIRTRRKSRRLPQADLAEIAGIAIRTLRAIEKGNGNPEMNTLIRICEVLGLRITISVIT
ncbi:MAG: helix-turn-helix domain-containing protein [Bacteroidota bacterium]